MAEHLQADVQAPEGAAQNQCIAGVQPDHQGAVAASREVGGGGLSMGEVRCTDCFVDDRRKVRQRTNRSSVDVSCPNNRRRGEGI